MVQPAAIADGTVHTFVGGEWQASAGPEGTDAVNLASGETLAYVPYSTAEEVDGAVSAGPSAV